MNDNDNVKADLDKLDMLRDQALCGPEEKRGQSQQAYEELRSELLDHEQCQGCDDDSITKELKMEDKDAEAAKTLVEDKAKGIDRETNKADARPEDLPW